MIKTILGIMMVTVLGLGIISKIFLTHVAAGLLVFILTPVITIWTLIEVVFKFFEYLSTIDWKRTIVDGALKKRIASER